MFCGGAQGLKQEMQCLKENKERLSPQCKMHILTVLRANLQVYLHLMPGRTLRGP